MAGFYEVINRIFQPYKTLFFFTFLVILFGLISYFIYTKYLSNYINDRKYTDVANSMSRDDGLQIYFFYADWCPHCKNAKPDWNNFRSQVEGTQTASGYKVRTVAVDCTNLDTDIESAQLVKEYDITGFPTVFAMKDNKRIDYDAKVDLTSLNQFLNVISK
jgi:thiol-disulfide isomerase/thioredoxin